MTLDKAIRVLNDTHVVPFYTVEEVLQIVKWLKELKKWRRGEMHCKSHSERAIEKCNIGSVR